MNKQRIFIIFLALVGAVSVFLPWVSSAKGYVDGIQFPTTGWIILALFIVTILVSLLGDRKSNIKGIFFYVLLLFPLASAIIAISNIMTINSQMSRHHGNLDLYEIGFGLYVIIIVGVVIPLLGFLLKRKKNQVLTENIES